MKRFQKEYTFLEFILLFATSCLVGVVIVMAYYQSELINALIGVMSHYGEALERLVEYEPNNEYWRHQLEGVYQYFDIIEGKT